MKIDLAKVTKKRQVTIPKVIRDILGLNDGSKVLFIKKGDDIVIKNSAMVALEKIQNAFDGEEMRLGLTNEDDVVQMIKEFRNSKKIIDFHQKLSYNDKKR